MIRWDVQLYAHAARLFAARLAQMQAELSADYGQQSADRPPEFRPGVMIDPSGSDNFDADLCLELLRRRDAAPRKDAGVGWRFSFDGPVPGLGWYATERHSQFGPFRWSGPATRSTLKVTLPQTLRKVTTPLRLRCHVISAIAPDVLLSWQLLLNDQVLPLTHKVNSVGTHLFSGELKPELLAGCDSLEITFVVTRTASGKNDRRQIGLAVSWVDIRPYEEQDRHAVAGN
jgi:hypothetical protein